MSFHVILPSNSSMMLYPENTLADFCVKLAKPIVLTHQYKVALEELIYPQIHRPFGPREVYIDVIYFEDGSEKVEKRIWIDMSSTEPANNVIFFINHHLAEYRWVLLFPDKEGLLEFSNSDDENVPKPLRLHPKLAYVLGFGNGNEHSIILGNSKIADSPCLLYNLSHQMFIYANIVDHQRVGDSLVPLLRICVTLPSENKLVSEKYIKPYYVPVCKQHIEEIRIQIRNHTGELFPFPQGTPLIVKLHFKPA